MGFIQAALKIIGLSTTETLTAREAFKGAAVIAGVTYVAGSSVTSARRKDGKEAIGLGPITVA